MARFNHGALSRAVNKLGGVVFQQYEGMQIGKEYQPNVKNPNTEAQFQQRAMFSLASKVNALIYPFLGPVEKANGIIYTRFQRGHTLKQLLASIIFDAGNDAAVLGSMPNFRPNGQTSVPVVATVTTSSIPGNWAIVGTAVPNAPVFVELMAISASGEIIVRTAATTAAVDGKFSADLGEAVVGFQGVLHGMAYCTEETESNTGVTYADIAGATSTTIASLGIGVTVGTSIYISNLAANTLWEA